MYHLFKTDVLEIFKEKETLWTKLKKRLKQITLILLFPLAVLLFIAAIPLFAIMTPITIVTEWILFNYSDLLLEIREIYAKHEL